jgi:hypothetical protein
MTGALHEEKYTFFTISRSVRQTIKTFETKATQKIKTNFSCSIILFENREIMWKIWKSRTDHRWQHGACALHAGYLRLQTNTS